MSATSLFHGKAVEYARYRVDYPGTVISAALKSVGVVPEDVIADLGSGTGMLSRWFLERGNRVFGVEPDDGMRQVAENSLRRFGAGFTSIDGTAERTSLGDSSVTVVAAGNAFHYFDPHAARTETERILQRGGRVLIVGHDSASKPNDFMQAYLDFIAGIAVPEIWAFHERDRSSRAMEAFVAGSHFHEEDMGDHTFHLTWDGLHGRFLSTSVAPAEGDPRRAAAITQLSDVFRRFEKDGTVPFQLRWRYSWCRMEQTV
jgi:ubiquinone/menaquinone biosynthesis C-methylase UbiE